MIRKSIKIISVAFWVCLLAAIPAAPAYALTTPRIYVSGAEIPAGGYYFNGRVMTSVAVMADALGAEVEWSESTQDIFVYLYGRYAWVQATNPTMYYGTYIKDANGAALLTGVNALPLDARPSLKNGRAYAPLAQLAEALGGIVTWDPASETANVTPPAFSEVPVRGGTEQAAPGENAVMYDLASQFDVVINAGEENAGNQVKATDTSGQREWTGYYRLLDGNEAAEKYTNDEPFVLIVHNGGLHPGEFRETLRAAADLQLVVYGYDTAVSKEALPFAEENANEPRLYFIYDSERVETLDNFSYKTVSDALLQYWSE
ncbi:MAG: copper amine oxidase N-terminal domain-containing protein [Clostridiales bacterium]|jgi:hypothetical protein|nr:copper amine oxidase N-terminal domain-containing protein [Clostridiales bacterium]